MPIIPKKSPATGADNLPVYYIHTTANHFVDNHGRVLILRGVNLCGSSKTPVTQPSHVLDGFWESVEADDGHDFIGRPLGDLSEGGEADVHLTRLRGWGFSILRYVFTWEALEHRGPGQYDETFIDYTIQVLQKCKKHGFKVFMDPHQDVWSRFSGGDGAPYWTLLACGINPRHITATQAAIIHQEYPDPANPDPSQFPAMIWGTNYTRTLSQTMFTLFFAGRDFAPKCIIDGVNIQDWLQGHYIAAVGYLAKRIRDSGEGLLDSCIIGWDSLNEPFEGYCGLADLTVVPPHQALKKGSNPTPAQGIRLAYGQAQTVEYWEFGSFGPKRNGSVTIDPDGVKLWIDPDVADEPEGVSMRWGWKRDPGWKLGECIWAIHGVWEPASGTFLKPDYFARPGADPTRTVVFLPDYWRPHWRAYTQEIRKYHPEQIPFVQPPVFMAPPPLDDEDLKGRACFSPHYYDGLTLMTRHWNWFNADALGVLRGKYSSPIFALKVGEKAIRASLREQLGILKQDCLDILGPFPTLMGEIGTPMDMDAKAAYYGSKKGDYSNQTKALDASLNATDGINTLNYTVWTYTGSDSTHKWGDGWNLEDLSLYSPDDLRSEFGGWKVPYLHEEATESFDSKVGGTRMVVQAVEESSEEDQDGVSSASASAINLNSLLHPRRSTAESTAFSTTSTLIHDSISLTSLASLGLPAFNSPSTAFSFLINGARAYKAFTRPYPLATVGTPGEWEFDINNAEFSMSLKVKREDIPYLDGDAKLEEVKYPTEFYLPLTHFAKDDVVRAAFGIPVERSRKRKRAGTSITDTTTLPPPEQASTSSTGKVDAVSHISNDEEDEEEETIKDAYDLEVTVSGGRFVITDFQTLEWYYPIPARSAAKDASLDYRITVKRRGGAIDFKKLGITVPGFETNQQNGTALLDKCCGEGCVLM